MKSEEFARKWIYQSGGSTIERAPPSCLEPRFFFVRNIEQTGDEVKCYFIHVLN